MLRTLHIQNLAIIQQLQLQFQQGLVVLTGETGAGKSIILGAVNLLLGARADSNIIYNNAEKCIIEAEFDCVNKKNISKWLAKNDIDETADLIIRREINNKGRSRAFINDTPVTLTQLSAIGEMLIDLHRQFDTLEIKESDFQLDVVDTIAENEKQLLQYQEAYKIWKDDNNVLNDYIANKNKMQQELQQNTFLFDELNKIDWQNNNIENAEQELAILNNAEALQIDLNSCLQKLINDDENIASNLKQTIQKLNNYTSTIKVLDGLSTRLQASLIEIKDIASELETISETVELDHQKLEKLNEVYNEGTRLLLKHYAVNTQELIVIKNNLNDKLFVANNIDEAIEKQKTKVASQHKIMLELATVLNATRNKSATKIQTQINSLLPKVGMPSAKLKIEITTVQFVNTGNDKIEFLFDANNTEKYLPINKVASGGELSRLMLCIKSLMAKASNMPTLIFDEIDTGISGEVAKQVVILMQELAMHHQIITVTHLPQIASKAQQHLFIYKQLNEQSLVSTFVKTLNAQEQVLQIAIMLAGDQPTQIALKIAKELIEN
jgi:DNA repair protein RecN (Recombination protein N)